VTSIVRAEGPGAPTLFGTSDPDEVVARAARHATALARVIKDRQLFTNIKGRNHVRVEGWTLLGSMIGVYAVPIWTHPVPEDWRDRGMDKPEGWQARVEARTLAGDVVGAATASCMRAERNWQDRDEYALESMAQTRATGKALRLPLGFVIVLAGYDATPAEEMPHEPAPHAAAYDDPAADQGGTPSAPAPRAKPAPDPELEERKRLFAEVKALTGSVKATHDLYRELLGGSGGVKQSDLTSEVLGLMLAAAQERAGGEIVEGEIVSEGA
jgi:hypothetical protein